MHISKIELENIKSHVRSTYNFQRGTTAITGANGAGKTSIIEAVAWVLFDLLEYKKEDFVRRGAKKGVVRVTFESGIDEREYIVYRDSGSGYNVTDPRLQTRIADKKEEVFRFLWQHLGLEPGTDLRSLFRQAIGVPQGTLTAIFLEGAAERKTAFDRLLKVEEYRQAAENLRQTSRFIDDSIANTRENIARAEGELLRSEKVVEEHDSVKKQLGHLNEKIRNISDELTDRHSRVKKFDEQEKRFIELKTALERTRSQKEKADIIVQQAVAALERATEAASKAKSARASHESHLSALERISELERERKQRDKLNYELTKTDAAITNVKAEHRRLDQELKNIAAARVEIETLRPKANKQAAIEKELDATRNDIARARNADERIKSIENELENKRSIYRANLSQIKAADGVTDDAGSLDELERLYEELVVTIAEKKAELDRDQKFQAEISNGLCPILTAKCLNIKSGDSLEKFLSNRSSELRSQITELEEQRDLKAAELKQARELQTLTGFQKLGEEIQKDAVGLKEKKIALEVDRNQLIQLEQRFSELQKNLKTLADPAARIRVLEQGLSREGEIQTELTKVESNLERLVSERNLLVEQLDEFKDLDKNWSQLTAQRDSTIEAHRTFITNETEASTMARRKAELDATKAKIADADADIAKAERDFGAADFDYNSERHKNERAELLNSERRLAETQATFEATRVRKEQLAAELQIFAEIRKTLRDNLQEKERLESVAEITSFIRDTLKEAAPRVARNYVHYVSIEANQMFREITGGATHTLKWEEDYAISLEEDGFERPFQSLSGGEQMAAALSVRLALLKQLSDIRLAFFDEPTTNMDAERRENLALQISRIKNFDQLFVISHDETFDNYVDNVVHIEKSPLHSAQSAA